MRYNTTRFVTITQESSSQIRISVTQVARGKDCAHRLKLTLPPKARLLADNASGEEDTTESILTLPGQIEGDDDGEYDSVLLEYHEFDDISTKEAIGMPTPVVFDYAMVFVIITMCVFFLISYGLYKGKIILKPKSSDSSKSPDEFEKDCDYTLMNPDLKSDSPLTHSKSLGFNSRPYIDVNFYRKTEKTYVFKRSYRSKISENRCIRQIGIKQNEI